MKVRRKGKQSPCAGWSWWLLCWLCFFFQAEDGIRDVAVTGVQTCALPISVRLRNRGRPRRVALACGGCQLEETRRDGLGVVAVAGVGMTVLGIDISNFQ